MIPRATLAGFAALALAALAVTDTLKRAAGGIVTVTIAREGLWRAQTPQGFHFAPILLAKIPIMPLM